MKFTVHRFRLTKNHKIRGSFSSPHTSTAHYKSSLLKFHLSCTLYVAMKEKKIKTYQKAKTKQNKNIICGDGASVRARDIEIIRPVILNNIINAKGSKGR